MNKIPVFPVKGEMLSIQGPSNFLKRVLFGPDIYLVPRDDGLVVVGDVVEVVAKPRRELREVRASDSETRTRGDVEGKRIRKAEREREVDARPTGRK